MNFIQNIHTSVILHGWCTEHIYSTSFLYSWYHSSSTFYLSRLCNGVLFSGYSGDPNNFMRGNGIPSMTLTQAHCTGVITPNSPSWQTGYSSAESICCRVMAGINDDPLSNKMQSAHRIERYSPFASPPITSSTTTFIECSATSCTVCLYPMVVYTSNREKYLLFMDKM